MEMTYTLLGAIGAGFVVGFIIAYLIRGGSAARRIKLAETEASQLIAHAKNQANALIKEAELDVKDRQIKMKNDFDAETAETRNELKERERRLTKKEENAERKLDQLGRRDRELVKKERRLSKRENKIDHLEAKARALVEEKKGQLEEISGMTADQAKSVLIHTMENEARFEGAKLIKRIETEARAEGDKKAKKILATAIQRYAGDFVMERTVSVVQLPSDDMKGRIIGREGRNIRALEAATGIDLIIDDTPEAVILSGFNPVRREVARLSLQKLISDGRIHPARIEDVVKKVEKEVGGVIKESGEQVAFDLSVHGIHPELIKLIGSLKFRTSYSQNVLQHSAEVGFLCGIMASELGLNAKLARRMGLLHDLGKAVDHEVDGPHATIGAKLARKYQEKSNVVQAIAAHHEDVPPTSVYDFLVMAADSLSGARPGARKESLENYVKRLEELEKIANNFKGVANTYAIQAGREVRVIVESQKVSDEHAILLSRDIAKEIEESVTFPGQIKVTVIRETRAVEYANR
jgi:ribonuclease Y